MSFPTITTAELRARFAGNVDRVRQLISFYEEITSSLTARPGVRESEILRAAVILLHASLEDFLRTLGSIRLPNAGPEILALLPFAGGDGRKTTLTLGDLAAYRGSTVTDVISDSVEAHLDRRSYNDVSDLASALRQVGLSPDHVAPFASKLEPMMKRRHNIAHRLDRNDSQGPGPHGPVSIGKDLIEGWLDNVEAFAESILTIL